MPHCYRHPDREAGRSCTRCGKAACSDCLVQANVGSHCLDCAKAARPDIATRARFWNSKQPTLMTFVLMGINFLVFAWTSLTDPSTLGGRGTLSPEQCDLGLSRGVLQYGGVCVDHYVQPEQWYRLISSGFLHYGIIHIAFNMFMLYQLGQLLERRLGRLNFTLLYFAALLGGSLGVLVFDQNALSGGASGAVFGLMAAAAVGLHRQGINVFSTGLGTTLMLNFFITFFIPGISIGGHVGGAVAGAACGYIMLAPTWKKVPKWAGYVTPMAVGVVCIVASVIIAHAPA
ncbi:MAG: rhomboid family protein [Ilumatobacteraceae bacterium]|nr:rhomboid family protein [Ilumatobacteraceae bacterium]